MAGARTVGMAAGAVVLVPVAAVMAITLFVTAVATWGDDTAARIERAGCTTIVSGTEGTAGNTIPNGWEPLLQAAADEAGIPLSIAAAQLQQESNWDEKAISHAGAMGLAQFMPTTWQLYGNGGDPFTAADAIPAYGRYMAALRREVDATAAGDPDLAVRLMLAAYNAGPGAVTAHHGIPPFNETEQYVARILANGQASYSPACEIPAGGEWNGDLGDGEWTNPLPGGTLSSGYGARNVSGLPAWAQNHVGVDLSTGTGKGSGGPVIAPTALRITGFNDPDGCVIAKEAGPDPDFGFAFCHLASHNVSVGEILQRGDLIGVEGNRAQLGKVATHLHFEIYKPEAPDVVYPYQGWNLDPEPILKEKGAWSS